MIDDVSFNPNGVSFCVRNAIIMGLAGIVAYLKKVIQKIKLSRTNSVISKCKTLPQKK